MGGGEGEATYSMTNMDLYVQRRTIRIHKSQTLSYYDSVQTLLCHIVDMNKSQIENGIWCTQYRALNNIDVYTQKRK